MVNVSFAPFFLVCIHLREKTVTDRMYINDFILKEKKKSENVEHSIFDNNNNTSLLMMKKANNLLTTFVLLTFAENIDALNNQNIVCILIYSVDYRESRVRA